MPLQACPAESGQMGCQFAGHCVRVGLLVRGWWCELTPIHTFLSYGVAAVHLFHGGVTAVHLFHGSVLRVVFELLNGPDFIGNGPLVFLFCPLLVTPVVFSIPAHL